MARRTTLTDMLQTLFERRGGRGKLADRSIEDLSLALLDVEGEVSGVALAQAVLDRYAQMSNAEKLAFFQFLNAALEIDPTALSTAVQTFQNSPTVSAYRQIGRAAEPRRQELLRRLNQPPGATQALVNMRADLIAAKAQDPDLARTDLDFQHLLRSWFNRGFLVLRQISWDTPATILEKIVEYEAVHAIQDWDDLRRRLYPEDRRCFAFFHPSMPDEPLIFVEVALSLGVPNSIQHVLSENRDQRNAQDTKVAVFYSISNCQDGLAGVSFGSLLIKQVVAELSRELPQLETFVTLSPIPKLAGWLASEDGATAGDADWVQSSAVRYLLDAKDAKGRPFDPVARFHLGNGAQIYAVHAGADLSPNGLAQSHGAMVNYQYDLGLIEQNHERFVQDQEICLAPKFKNGLGSVYKKKRISA
ncbi:malonyl-CoA decarboxylase [Cognatishimia sp.]|uniref:malonyl-CoA decarboxylase n=1 Tax=Cognatishimia sp. TaxID=2211648 RepID=UPI003516DE28